ncbi:MAG: hypothetical protein LBN00_10190 [Oscillospiraceae bacterium]|jgi:hypothetical protein|nr:hypothetical protein [Oscillospiraceae bacterium]
MKRIIATILCALAITSACAKQVIQEQETATEISGPAETYKAVLRDESGFFADGRGMTNKISLSDLYYDADEPWEIGQFAVVDLDGNGAFEVVVEEILGGERLVLYCYEGNVYGAFFAFRAMMNLKTDGTFAYSGGAAYNGIGQLYALSEGSAESKVLAESDTLSEEDENGALLPIYYVDGREATQDEFSAVWDDFTAKEDAPWYEFTEENIERWIA